MTRHTHPALVDAAPEVYWLDDPARPAALPALDRDGTADLVVVGGGYAGLWTALRAKERDPGLDVVVLEQDRCGDQASGRNGGFASASLTHGHGNGLARWPEELTALDRLGAENLDGIGATVDRFGIDCHWERTGELTTAAAAHEVDDLAELAASLRAAGHDVSLLDAAQTQARVASPTYLGGLLEPHATAMVEPARLAWGLRDACVQLGVRVHERTSVRAVDRDGAGLRVHTDYGELRAAKVVLATNAFPSLLRRLRLYTVPVYDYALMTEPLSPEQRAAVGWSGREGVGDASNMFHYYRLTRDDRILWGGYDAVYHYASRIDPRLEQSGRTHALLASQFFEVFPQLEGLRFTHRWAGVIDTCTRFSAFYGTAYDGRLAYALGFTGLGVAATRFAADVMLDLLGGADTERTRLRMVREKPLPFPPEPIRFTGVQLTRWSMAKADQNAGRQNLWLKAMDKVGLGFDS
ncbi:NAD(P)/FAD-dependent oxidoreductase [Nocardioides iriomotensis]|uniref:FAD-dependent oxidoreductase n=1 Tax=Nocardioides iriomotensis TaxID=715784 RepID=A0A4Q5J4F5_9ACTN|nr:FAD-dependent oxidoreductase [Nocardioides iriomotensis]RYU12381.1 FAD-dependent oxidoreductase [Nocardioides iriomotensis]